MLRAAQTLLAAQQGSAFTPVLVQHFAPGSGTDIVPLGATNVLIEMMGNGGGGNWVNGGSNINFAGGGGGPYCRLSVAVVGGESLNWLIGALSTGAVVVNTSASAAHDCTVTASLASGAVAMTAHGGAPALAGATTGSGGAGGTATGGSTNTAGQAGTVGQPIAGKGGNSAAPSGSPTKIFQGTGGFNDTVSNSVSNSPAPPGGGGGGYQTGATPASHGADGASGEISFYFT